jgi:hypothetical protein
VCAASDDSTATDTAIAPFQREFIEFALSQNVLKFGSFTLKSGRQSPYFFNAGLFSSGQALAKLGTYYAQAIVNAGDTVSTTYCELHQCTHVVVLLDVYSKCCLLRRIAYYKDIRSIIY